MQFKQLAMAAAVAATAFSAQATTDIQWWHSMTAVNNDPEIPERLHLNFDLSYTESTDKDAA